MKQGGLLLALCLAACAQKNEYVPPPPPSVTVAPPASRTVIAYAEFTGATEPTRVVEIRARVKGFLKEIKYQAGAVVEAGTILFEIDSAEYDANLQQATADVGRAKADLKAAEAEVKSAKASLELAETTVTKLEQAYKSRAVAEIVVIEAKARADVAKAQVDATVAKVGVAQSQVGVAEARRKRAALDKQWTVVKAPMKGTVGMWQVQVGDLVSAGTTLLATMVNDKQVWCWFNVSESMFLSAARAREAEGRPPEVRRITVDLARAGDEGFPFEGRGDYIDPQLDKETGTLRLRAIFDNPDKMLVGGLFVRVRIPIDTLENALLVTERAIGNDQSGSFVLVVGAEDKVERRDLKLGPVDGSEVVVLEGLKAGDRVIVAGLQRARPGAVVKPEAAKPAG
ncbi:MAG: efflux RND transporter periplasmic adaptor subunit [Planctomycetota bacterium]|jgi:membrane fusion protein (multidrug efflux system)